MASRLLITDSAYVLSHEKDGRWVELSRLLGGAQALLPGVRRLDEGQLEAAIQVAEYWLVPLAAGLRDEVLEVSDVNGRLQSGLAAVVASTQVIWKIAALEDAFLQVVDLATGRVAPPHLQAHRSFVADFLLLRELAHHGRVISIRLTSVLPSARFSSR